MLDYRGGKLHFLTLC